MKTAGVQSRGFTLLEAAIALALMAMILAASLELRVQAMRTGARVGEESRAAQSIAALHTMLINRALPDPQIDSASGQPVWSGTYRGLSYVITREREGVDNPLVGADPNAPAEVGVWRYSMTLGQEKASFLWFR